MNHTTTAPMILEALADEGLTAYEHSPYLRLPLGLAAEILITAGEKSGRSHFDLPAGDAYGFQASEFETGEGADGAAYVYATGMQPTKSLVEEARAMAAAVNRSVRGATGAPAAVLLALPLVTYLEREWVPRTGDADERARLGEIIAGAEERDGLVGCFLLRETANATMDLYTLRTALDDLRYAYLGASGVSDADLEKHGVRPYMIRAAYSAVLDRWKAPRLDKAFRW